MHCGSGWVLIRRMHGNTCETRSGKMSKYKIKLMKAKPDTNTRWDVLLTATFESDDDDVQVAEIIAGKIVETLRVETNG
jgi:hypothetical protein